MKNKPPILVLFVLWAIVSVQNRVYAQCELLMPPYRTYPLCALTLTSLSNTANTITINTTTTYHLVPPNGTYTVYISYMDNTGVCAPVITCYSANISSAGSATTIDLGDCASLPGYFSTTHVSINIISHAGAGTYYFQYANGECLTPPPMGITSWNIQRLSNNTVQVTWTTGTEYSGSQFVIERNSVASSGVTDMDIGGRQAVNPSGGSYSFIDQYPVNGTNWYRIREVYTNGNYQNTIYKSLSCPGCNVTPPLADCSGMALNGPDMLCSGTEQYSVSNMPYYTTCTWQLYSDVGGFSNTGGPATYITQIGADRRQVYASVKGCIGTNSTKTVSKWLTIGKAVNGTIESFYGNGIWGLKPYPEFNYLNPDEYGVYFFDPCCVNPTWTLLDGYVPYLQYHPEWYEIVFDLPSGGYAYFQMDVNTTCGPTTQYYYFMANSTLAYYSMSPNPATSTLNVYVDSKKLEKWKTKPSADQCIQQIIIADKMGNTVLKQNYPANTKNISLNIASLKPDVYTARVFNGKQWTAMKFIKNQ